VTPSLFLQHWGIRENPFRGEEARLDGVFCRITAGDSASLADNQDHTADTKQPHSTLAMAAQHADLEKFVGDIFRPASSVVFGEKGSGKTAMRLQLAQAVAIHNARQPDARVLLVAYDELHPFLERLHNRVRRVTRKGESTAAESLRQMRLADHIDAIMHLIVPMLVDQVLDVGETAGPGPRPALPPHLKGMGDPERIELGDEARKLLRKTDPVARRDLLALCAAYDRTPEGNARVRPLRRALQVRRPLIERFEAVMAYFGWLPPAAVALWLALTAPKVGIPAQLPPVPLPVAAATAEPVGGPALANSPPALVGPTALTSQPALIEAAAVPSPAVLGRSDTDSRLSASNAQFLWRQLQDTFGLTGTTDPRTLVWTTLFVSLLMIWIIFLSRRAWTDRFRLARQAGRLHRQVRITGRGEAATFDAVRALPASLRSSTHLPVNDSEDARLSMFSRLRRILRLFGYSGIVVVVDRVDEPLIVSGDADRMKSIIWPMLTSKFLQLESVGIKLLLPIELRHLLFKESASFFQQARLDKQNLVESLGWSGSTLYDLCTARLIACRGLSTGQSGKQMLALADLFEADVGRATLIEMLDQMRQPRDAFKFLYQCINEHCARATEDQSAYEISRRTLEDVRRGQVERLRQLALGVRPG